MRTTKYTAWNFVPLNLFGVQLAKMANIYFLIITVMSVIPAITITNGKAVMAFPLCTVVLISMLKDGFEDIKRYLQDKEDNEKEAEVFNRESK